MLSLKRYNNFLTEFYNTCLSKFSLYGINLQTIYNVIIHSITGCWSYEKGTAELFDRFTCGNKVKNYSFGVVHICNWFFKPSMGLPNR